MLTAFTRAAEQQLSTTHFQLTFAFLFVRFAVGGVSVSVSSRSSSRRGGGGRVTIVSVLFVFIQRDVRSAAPALFIAVHHTRPTVTHHTIIVAVAAICPVLFPFRLCAAAATTRFGRFALTHQHL